MINKKLNNKGFGKYEVLTVIVVIIIIMAFLMNKTLGGASSRKLSTFRDNALTFGKTIRTDSTTYSTLNVVYLQQAIADGVMNKIKSPFGGTCDETESKYFVQDDKPYVTLKCGDYLIDSSPVSDVSNAKVYKVGKWSTKKLSGDNVEEKTLYNCTTDGKEEFDDYKEDLYFVYQINNLYGSEHMDISDVTECDIVEKTYYRTREEVE